MKVLVVADPLESLHVQTDTTLILCREARKRGLSCFYCLKNGINIDQRRATALVSELDPTEKNPKLLDKPKPMPMRDFRAALMRQDPPFDMGYYSAAVALTFTDVPTLNEPEAVLTEPEKLIPLRFGKFCPPTLISADKKAIGDFFTEYGKNGIVLKPLYGYGGKNVVSVKNQDELAKAAPPLLAEGIPIVAQELLPQVRDLGDRRAFTLDGKFVGGFARIPPSGSILANLARGGRATKCAFTDAEQKICEEVAGYLKKVGILFAGLDLIDGRLIEVNVTSPTGLYEYHRLSGINLAADIWNILLKTM